jgi:hypothetical protein
LRVYSTFQYLDLEVELDLLARDELINELEVELEVMADLFG